VLPAPLDRGATPVSGYSAAVLRGEGGALHQSMLCPPSSRTWRMLFVGDRQREDHDLPLERVPQRASWSARRQTLRARPRPRRDHKAGELHRGDHTFPGSTRVLYRWVSTFERRWRRCSATSRRAKPSGKTGASIRPLMPRRWRTAITSTRTLCPRVESHESPRCFRA